MLCAARALSCARDCALRTGLLRPLIASPGRVAARMKRPFVSLASVVPRAPWAACSLQLSRPSAASVLLRCDPTGRRFITQKSRKRPKSYPIPRWKSKKELAKPKKVLRRALPRALPTHASHGERLAALGCPAAHSPPALTAHASFRHLAPCAPQLKSHAGAMKRFRLRADGTWTHAAVGKRHLMAGSRRKVSLKKRKPVVVKLKGFIRKLRALMPYGTSRRRSTQAPRGAVANAKTSYRPPLRKEYTPPGAPLAKEAGN